MTSAPTSTHALRDRPGERRRHARELLELGEAPDVRLLRGDVGLRDADVRLVDLRLRLPLIEVGLRRDARRRELLVALRGSRSPARGSPCDCRSVGLGLQRAAPAPDRAPGRAPASRSRRGAARPSPCRRCRRSQLRTKPLRAGVQDRLLERLHAAGQRAPRGRSTPTFGVMTSTAASPLAGGRPSPLRARPAPGGAGDSRPRTRRRAGARPRTTAATVRASSRSSRAAGDRSRARGRARPGSGPGGGPRRQAASCFLQKGRRAPAACAGGCCTSRARRRAWSPSPGAGRR